MTNYTWLATYPLVALSVWALFYAVDWITTLMRRDP